jgi:hypothetical protein
MHHIQSYKLHKKCTDDITNDAGHKCNNIVIALSYYALKITKSSFRLLVNPIYIQMFPYSYFSSVSLARISESLNRR